MKISSKPQLRRNRDGTLGPLHITDQGIELRSAMTLEQALQALHERLGNDPDCDCDDCELDREILEQLAGLS